MRSLSNPRFQGSKATPNHSIERTSQRLRLCAATHVQRWTKRRSHVGTSPAISKQFRRRVTIIGVVLVIVALANFVIYAARKVAEGHGLDLYVTGSGAKTSYLSTVVLFAILPVILGAAWIWSRWSKED